MLKIARYVNGYVRRFRLECPRDSFPRLRNAVVVQRRETALKAVKVELEAQLSSEWESLSTGQTTTTTASTTTGTAAGSTAREPCMGDCGALANVRIVKRCATCEERDECHCDPAWCHQCILKWWIEKVSAEILIDCIYSTGCLLSHQNTLSKNLFCLSVSDVLCMI